MPVNETVKTSSLILDGQNPRLESMQYLAAADPPWNQEDIISLGYARSPATNNMINSIRDNQYLGAPALLITREDDRNIVIDGNRQLAAVRIISNPELWDQFIYRNPQQERLGRPVIALANHGNELQVIYFPNRDEARRAQISRHQYNRDSWSTIGLARYYRRMLLQGWDEDTLNRHFGRAHTPMGENNPHYLVHSVDLWETLTTRRDYPTPISFARFNLALQMRAVAKKLQLASAAQYQPNSLQPLEGEPLYWARNIVVSLCGTPADEPEPKKTLVDDNNEIRLLEKILDDETMTQRFLSGRHRSLAEILSYKDQQQLSHIQIASRLESLESEARETLAGMKKENPAVNDPSTIHVGDVSYQVHSDGFGDFRITLISDDHGRDEPVRSLLQKYMSPHQQRDCTVTFA